MTRDGAPAADRPTSEEAPAFYAKTYDASVSDWPGDLDFYPSLAR